MSNLFPIEEILEKAQQPSNFASDLLNKKLNGSYVLEISGGPEKVDPKSFSSHTIENAFGAAMELFDAGFALRITGPNGLDWGTNEIAQQIAQIRSLKS
jgi:hypothetical protein